MSTSFPAPIGKLTRLSIAWLVGGAIYFLYAIATVYDGFPSVICQPFMAMGVSAVFVFAALIVGLPLVLLTPHRPDWLVLLVAGVGLLMGLALLFVPTIFSSMFRGIVPLAQGAGISEDFVPVYLGYFIVILTIVNWPRIDFQKLVAGRIEKR